MVEYHSVIIPLVNVYHQYVKSGINFGNKKLKQHGQFKTINDRRTMG
jgi:hypothetical protein